MAFITKVDFSDNRQVKQYQLTNTNLSGATQFGVSYSGLTGGVDESTITTFGTLSGITSTFSGNTDETIFFFDDSRLNSGIETIEPITTTNSSSTQIGRGFVGINPIIIDGNTVYQSYTGSTFDLTVTSIVEIATDVFTGTTISDEVSLLSGDSKDYSKRTIWVDVKGITRTQKMILLDEPEVNDSLTTSLSRNSEGEIRNIKRDYITGYTYNPNTNTFLLEKGSGKPNLSATIDAVSGLTVNGQLSATTITSDVVNAETIFSGGTELSSLFPSFIKNDNDFVTGSTFNTSTGDLTLSTLSGNTIVENLDGRYLTSETDSQTLSWDGTQGQLTISNGNTVDLDGRYSLTGHTHVIEDITDFPTDVSFFNNDVGYITGFTNTTYTTDVISSSGDTIIRLSGSDSSTDDITLVGGTNTSLDVTGDTITFNSLADTSSGLEALDEGNGIGYRIIGRDPANYGNIGLNAVDLSTSDLVSTTRGATGTYSHAEGFRTTASGVYSHAEGSNAIASGFDSHAEGLNTTASGNHSHAEGYSTTATNFASHAEGTNTTASGKYSHAEGANTTASADYSHAEGWSSNASGKYSHAEGSQTQASGENSHTQGVGNFARSYAEHSGGFYGSDYTPTDTDTDRLVNYGNGTTITDSRGGISTIPSDAFTIYKNGAVRFFRNELSGITNTNKEGFLIYDSGNANRPTIHNGTAWKALAYVDEISSSGITYSTSVISSSGDTIIRLSGSDSSTDDITLVGGTNTSLDVTGDTITFNSLAGSLEAIDEGNGIGYRLRGKDPSQHENIGNHSIDLLKIYDPNLVSGASGEASFAAGADNLSSAFFSVTFGYLNKATANYAVAFGYNNEVSGQNSVVFGANNIVSGDTSAVFGLNNVVSKSKSFSAGNQHINTGESSSTLGVRCIARAAGETVVGTNSFDITAVNATQNDGRDLVFHVGASNDQNNRRSQLMVFKSGFIKLTPINITNTTINPNVPNGVEGGFGLDNQNANRPTIHNGTEWKALAYVDDISSSGITYTTSVISSSGDTIIRLTGSDSSTDDITLVGGSNITLNTSGDTITINGIADSTTYTNGAGLDLIGTEFSHSDTSTISSTNNSGRTYIQNIDLDTFGHITGLTTSTETVVNSDDYVTGSTFNTSTGDLTLNTLSGNTVVENLDGRYTTINEVSNNYLPLSGGTVTGGVTGTTLTLDSVKLEYQKNIDVDSLAPEVVASVESAAIDVAFFNYVVKKGVNLRGGVIMAVHDGTNVEFTDNSTNDLGDTSGVTFSVDLSGGNLRLLANTTTDNWEIKVFVKTM